jgi:hypothetical protein
MAQLLDDGDRDGASGLGIFREFHVRTGNFITLL